MKLKNKIAKALTAIHVMAYLFAMNATITLADNLQDSKIATGTMQLLNDTTSWLMALLPVAGAVAIVYFSIRKNFTEDEQEGRMWTKRIRTSLICIAVGEAAVTIIKIIVSYYGG